MTSRMRRSISWDRSAIIWQHILSTDFCFRLLAKLHDQMMKLRWSQKTDLRPLIREIGNYSSDNERRMNHLPLLSSTTDLISWKQSSLQHIQLTYARLVDGQNRQNSTDVDCCSPWSRLDLEWIESNDSVPPRVKECYWCDQSLAIFAKDQDNLGPNNGRSLVGECLERDWRFLLNRSHWMAKLFFKRPENV